MFIRPELSIDAVECWQRQLDTLKLALAACQRQWDSRRIKEEQRSRLSSLMRFAAEHVPYYRHTWSALGIDPEGVASHGDLSQLPLLGREDVQRHAGEMLSDDWQRLGSRWNRTSGSTGQPVRSMLGANHDMVFSAVTLRAREAMGIPWGARVLQLVPRQFRLRAIPPHPVHWINLNGLSATWECDPSALDPETLTALFDDVRPDVLLGNTHLLRHAAERTAARKRVFRGVSWIINSFEPLDPDDAELLRSRFPNARLEDIYGCSEVGDLAWLCAEGGYHVNADFYIIELMRDDRAVASGSGEVTVTDLWNQAMPLLRYRTGDIADWDKSDCRCGRKLPRLKGIRGRTAPLLSLPDGQSLSSYSVMGALQAAGVDSFRVRQQADLELELFVPEPRGEAARRGAAALSELVAGRVPVEVRPLDELDTAGHGPIIKAW